MGDRTAALIAIAILIIAPCAMVAAGMWALSGVDQARYEAERARWQATVACLDAGGDWDGRACRRERE